MKNGECVAPNEEAQIISKRVYDTSYIPPSLYSKVNPEGDDDMKLEGWVPLKTQLNT